MWCFHEHSTIATERIKLEYTHLPFPTQTAEGRVKLAHFRPVSEDPYRFQRNFMYYFHQPPKMLEKVLFMRKPEAWFFMKQNLYILKAYSEDGQLNTKMFCVHYANSCKITAPMEMRAKTVQIRRFPPFFYTLKY